MKHTKQSTSKIVMSAMRVMLCIGLIIGSISPFVSVKAAGPQQLTVQASASAGGTITPSGTYQVNYGSSQSFVITPDNGYHLLKIIANGVDYTPRTNFNWTFLTTNLTVSAVFEKDAQANIITAVAGPNGAISPGGATSVNYGMSQTYTITPNTGFQIDSLSIDGIVVANGNNVPSSYTFSNVIMSHSIEATFIETSFNVTSSAGPNGTITPLGTTTIATNGVQGYTITPNVGYYVEDILVDNVSVGPFFYYVIPQIRANHTIQAVFGASAFDIIASAGPNGTITPTGTTTVQKASSMTYTITPNPQYVIADVLVDGVSVGPIATYTFSNVLASHTISAQFVPSAYMIIASAGPNGTITPTGTTTVNYGASQQFTITPNVPYQIESLLVDGNPVATTTSYVFSNATSSHTISASFSLIPDTVPPVITILGGNPMIITQGAQFIDPGVNVIDNIDQNPGHTVSGAVDTTTRGTYVLTYTAIDASQNTATATRTVIVTASPAITSIVVTPTSTALLIGGTQQITATGLDQFGGPIAATITWVSGNQAVATVDMNGLVTAVATGTATITASSGSVVSGGVVITVTAPPPICQTGADMNGDGAISNLEILNYVRSWKSGNVVSLLLLKAISFWKAGTGC